VTGFFLNFCKYGTMAKKSNITPSSVHTGVYLIIKYDNKSFKDFLFNYQISFIYHLIYLFFNQNKTSNGLRLKAQQSKDNGVYSSPFFPFLPP